ncbi:MAG: ABC transporter ATP-binding protein/permease [Bacilli bacterium]|nr:ABC transporter ATP-binding protein/permease [Bacilli bacterium]MBN2696456.1 ABC transporter ATP-binding protein/permease [Bacilli bacterium]
MISVKNLDKYFNKGKQNEIHVINNTSIDFPETGLVALTGPSGCGKTTLLNVIGGLDKFAKGEIYFDGNIIKKYKPLEWDILRNKYVGYIFQNYNLLTDKTVYENVEISLNMAGLYDKEKTEERINYVLDSVGMYNYRRRNVQALSGGQQQRVAIARAIAKNPKVVLADEPTGNLDVNNTFEIMSIIKKISQTCLVILVSHERELVDFYADRIIELKDGEIINDFDNQGDKTLEHVDSRNIYLRDLEKETTADPVPIEYFYERAPGNRPNIKVISVNNTIYIKADADQKIKYVTDDSEVRLLDQNYKKPETSDVTQHIFDLHQFGKIDIDSNRHSFIRFKDTLKAGFLKLIHKRKLISKMFLLAYFVISALIAYNLATLTNITSVQDEDFLTTSRNLVSVEITNSMDVDDVYEILENSSATNLSYYQNTQLTTFNYSNFYQSDKQSYYGGYGNQFYGYPVRVSSLTSPSIVIGSLPTTNRQVAIDKWLADELLEKSDVINMGGSSYEDLLDITITPNGYMTELEIVGIIDTDSPIMVVTDANFPIFYRSYSSGTVFLPRGVALGDYNITEGRDIAGEGEVLVSENAIFEVGQVYTANNIEYDIVGKFASDTISYNILDDASYERFVLSQVISDKEYYYEESLIHFETDDVELTVSEIDDLGFIAKDAYEAARAEHTEWVAREIAGKLRMITIALVGSLVYLVFMMRSSILSRVKEIGIYRSIGATRRDVAKIFVSEILAFTTIGSLFGYVVMTIIIIQFQRLNPLAVEEFYFPLHIFLAGIIGIYLLNILFGMSPVFTLLQKTPSEINAKYDI